MQLLAFGAMAQDDTSKIGTAMAITLSTSFYREQYPDLSQMDDAALAEHFEQYGEGEGRLSHPLATRENLIAECLKSKSILEIGPFGHPVVRNKNVSYFDVLNQDDLIARAKRVGQPTDNIPRIDFVSPTGDLSIVDKVFHAAISSHCIEHQVDLVTHLRGVAQLLKEDGKYFLIVPDKRYCFDSLLAESNIAEVIDSHFSQRKLHSLASVIEHRALVTHNDPMRHWTGDHGSNSPSDIADRTRAAIQEFEDSKGGYIDVHAWTFTPRSFALIFETLHGLDMSPFRVQSVHATPFGRNEFTAILQKCAR